MALSHWHYDTFRMPDWNIEAPGVYLLTFTLGPDGGVGAFLEDSLGAFQRVD